MTHIPIILASALSLAPLAGCASRQRPAEYPATSAASLQSRSAAPAVVTQAFQDDLDAAAAGAATPAPGGAAADPQEPQHGHHHH
jgi:outer membrane murein-binding lipoprotein Lpp